MYKTCFKSSISSGLGSFLLSLLHNDNILRLPSEAVGIQILSLIVSFLKRCSYSIVTIEEEGQKN